MNIKERLPLTIIGIIFITVVITYLIISGPANQNGGTLPIKKPAENITPVSVNFTLNLMGFPPEIQGEILTLSDTYSIDPEYWGFDPFNNEIDLLERDIPNKSSYKDLSGKKIGNYSIHIFNRTELEITRSEVQDYLFQFFHTSDYQISNSITTFDMDGRPYVDVECEKFTPENKRLENTTYKGWRIHVYVCCGVPSITITPKYSTLNREMNT